MGRLKYEPLVLDEEQYETIQQLAATNYSPERIALFLGINKQAFMHEWYDKDSQVRYRYDKGALESEFIINQKQLENAQAGNITAAQVFLKEAERIRIENVKKQILFGGFEIPDEETE
ncbi:hypothetical protein ACLI1A_10175 [Flavobacterium sp. RHBU_3]|uniref:hypothetical protein n=1 Tax=Flavobacterium sp. RHBU_3 TaxID=3391184 RepID=UPI00398487FD